MRLPASSRTLPAIAATAATAAALGLIALVLQAQSSAAPALFELVAVLVIFAGAGYLIWQAEPAYVFCAAILLFPLNGNWSQLGIPGWASPDRLLLLGGIAAVVLRSAGARHRPRLRIQPVHWLMLAAAAYAVISALIAGSLFDRAPAFKLLETYGIEPFLVFLVAPLVFRTTRERDLLLKTFVLLGLYLSLTTIFEAIHLDALVWPKYILDPTYGNHAGRGRGPFVEAVTNGYALYVCAVACAIAFWRWRGRGFPQRAAGVVGLLCIAGAFLSLERSIWLSAVVATLFAAFAIDDARRYLPAMAVTLAVAVGGSMLLIPGLADRVSERANNQGSIWDRKNLNRAALNMIKERPLVGFGWSGFLAHDRDYFQQARDYPLGDIAGLNVHSTVLTYAVDLGLIGLGLWLVTIVTGVASALSSRGPPDLRGWRIGLLAVAVSFVIVTNFVPPSHFPNAALWLFAGVCWSGRYATRESESGARSRPAVP